MATTNELEWAAVVGLFFVTMGAIIPALARGLPSAWKS